MKEIITWTWNFCPTFSNHTVCVVWYLSIFINPVFITSYWTVTTCHRTSRPFTPVPPFTIIPRSWCNYNWNYIMTWFIKYICYWKLPFLNHVIIIKKKLRFCSLRHRWLYCFGPLFFMFRKTFKIFGFLFFWLWTYLMKVDQKRVIWAN